MPPRWTRRKRRLNAARSAVDAWNSANTRVEDASRREKLQGQRVEVAVREHEAAEAEAQEAQQEWRQWLQGRGLDETLTTDTMTTFLARVDTTHSALSEARRMRDRVAAIEYDIHEFREQVERAGLPSRTAAGHRRPASIGQGGRRIDPTVGRGPNRCFPT